MTRKTKWMLRIVGTIVAGTLGFLGWQAWLIDGYTAPIEWEAANGGLVMRYQPLKSHLVLIHVTDA